MAEALIAAVGPWWFLFAIPVAILGVGRWARVVTHDTFPPAMWWRQKWAEWTTAHDHSEWYDLFACWWCFTPWLMLICIAWFALGFVALWIAWTWWLFFGWGALAYVSSIVLSYDEPKDSE